MLKTLKYYDLQSYFGNYEWNTMIVEIEFEVIPIVA